MGWILLSLFRNSREKGSVETYSKVVWVENYFPCPLKGLCLNNKYWIRIWIEKNSFIHWGELVISICAVNLVSLNSMIAGSHERFHCICHLKNEWNQFVNKYPSLWDLCTWRYSKLGWRSPWTSLSNLALVLLAGDGPDGPIKISSNLNYSMVLYWSTLSPSASFPTDIVLTSVNIVYTNIIV